MLSLCAAVAVLVLCVSFDTAWRLDAGRAGIKLVLVPVVLHMPKGIDTIEPLCRRWFTEAGIPALPG